MSSSTDYVQIYLFSEEGDWRIWIKSWKGRDDGSTRFWWRVKEESKEG